MKSFFYFLFILGGAICGWGFSLAMESVTFEDDPRAEFPPCFEVGAPFHHRFRPNCTGVMNTPRGEVPLSINEDGLREIARPHALKQPKRIVVLGDSFVEGWWASRDQSIPSLLQQRFPEFYFINAGLRSTGTVMQAARLKEVIGLYKPSGIIWILNDTDPLDDRFACAIQDEEGFGVPELALHGWRKVAVSLLGATAPANRLRRQFYGENWQSLAQSEAAGLCDPCRGVIEIGKITQVPLISLFLPIHSALPRHHYAQPEFARAELLECLEKKGIRTAMALSDNMTKEEIDRYFWEKDFHLNPEGMAYFVDHNAPGIEEWLRKIKSPAARKGAGLSRNKTP